MFIVNIIVGFITGILKAIYKAIYMFFKFTGLLWVCVGEILHDYIYPLMKNKGANDWLLLIIEFVALAFILAFPVTLVNNVLSFICRRKISIFGAIGTGIKRMFGALATGHEKHGYKAKVETSIKPHGIVFGKKNGYVCVDEEADAHFLIVGGPGSGKTSGVIIPTLCAWKEAVFAIDIKGELYEKTAEKRNRIVKVFNPKNNNAYSYDPFGVFKYADNEVAAAREIAISMIEIPENITDPYWKDNARTLLAGLLLYCYHEKMSFPESVVYIKSTKFADVAEKIKGKDQNAWLLISDYAEMLEMDNLKTFSGIQSELSNSIIEFASNPELLTALDGNRECLSPYDLENGADIYIQIPEYEIEQWKNLVSMMIKQFLKYFERRNEAEAKPVLMMIDEFPRLGKIDAIQNALATLRSKKVKIGLAVQSIAQLDLKYNKDMAKVLLDNCSYTAVLKATDYSTAEYFSKRVGTGEKVKKSSNQSYNRANLNIGMNNGNSGTGTGKTTEEKALIKPEVFMYDLAEKKKLILFTPNGFIKINRIEYWKDSSFK